LPAKKDLNHIYTSLIEDYGNRLYRLCLKLTYSKVDADDLFSETLLKVFEQPSKILESDYPERFLFSTASYLFQSKKRKYARRMRLVPVVPLSDENRERIKDDKDVIEKILQDEMYRALNYFIEGLPEKFKLPLVFYYTMEMSVTEISLTLNVPSGTVMSRLKRGRERLKKQLMEAGYDEQAIGSF